jgi:hypothetical protein
MTYDPALSHFDLDLKRGAQGEFFVQDVAEMLADGSGRTEVKTDAWFVHSNRLYIEHECQGRDGQWRPSGIAVTKSKLWAFRLGKHSALFVFDTDWLRRAYELAKSDARNLTKCSYGENPTRGVYVYLNHLMKTRDTSKDEHDRS